MSACSTYYSHYYQKPVENSAGWQVRKAESNLGYEHQYFAEYSDDSVKVSVTVPLSGSRQQFAGPCLVPFLPIRKDKPVPFDILFHIELQSGRNFQAYPGSWNAVTHGEDQMDAFGPDEVKTARPYRVTVKNKISGQVNEKMDFPNDWKVTGTGATEIRIIYYDAYDLSFEKFTLTNMSITQDGRQIDLPPLIFERKSEGRYLPYTTQFLEVL